MRAPATKLLIDTDTASDDAIALLLVLRHPGVEVGAITVVAGNVPLEQGVQNALYTLELVGSELARAWAGHIVLSLPMLFALKAHFPFDN